MTHATFTPTARGAGNPLYDLSTNLAARVSQLRHRRTLRRMLDLENYALEDMGVIRGEIDWVLSLPLSIDAGTELRRLSKERRKAHM